MDEGYCYDADTWCGDCLPVPVGHPEVGLGDGEWDSPVHCNACGRPLTHSLTGDGVRYVVESLAESLATATREELLAVHGHWREDDYYRGSPACAVERDWAEGLRNYYLLPADELVVEEFLKYTAPAPAGR